MDSNISTIILVSAVIAVLGVIATVIYYFSRFYVRSDFDRDIERVKSELAREAQLKASETQEPPSTPPLIYSPSEDSEVTTAEPLQTLEEVPIDLATKLTKTRAGFWGRIRDLFGASTVPSDILESLEEIMFTSDLGPATVQRLMAAVEEQLGRSELQNVENVREALRREMMAILQAQTHAGTVLEALKVEGRARPLVWLVVGVNGAGKTTTIGKLANLLARSEKKVLVAAGDTFRAAAGEQLKIWSDRAKVEIFSPEGVTDPAAVAYEACEKAKSSGADVVIIDTAGRLHTQKNLMEELKKVKRVIQKVIADAPHETLLVLDANSGQNALVQAREFNQALELSGVILTKMDGTAKGGVALAIAHELGLAVRLIGVGEGLADLRPFAAREYVESIL